MYCEVAPTAVIRSAAPRSILSGLEELAILENVVNIF
jgi:hypothetical protein